MAKISVIVPIYNVEEYLSRCIDSILNQTFTDFELILVDDGSPDNCGKICDEYALKYARIHVIHKEHGGPSDARNVGIDYAFTTNSEWITFVDSDDWVQKDYLNLLYNTALKYNVDISAGKKIFVDEKTVIEDDKNFIDCKITSDELFLRPNADVSCISYISACAKLYKKELFSDVRFPYGKISEDKFTTHKLIFKCSHIAIITKCIYYYFTNENSILHRTWTPRNLDTLQATIEQIEFFDKLAKEKVKFVCIGGYIYELFNQITKIRIAKKKYPKKYDYNFYEKKLKKELKLYIRKYNKKLDLFKNNQYVFFVAYPFTMRVFVHLRRLKDRIFSKNV